MVHHGARSPTLLVQSDPHMIKEIVEAVSIPVMAKVRIGHFVEAQVTALFLSLRITGVTRMLNSVIVSFFLSRNADFTKHWNRLHR